MKVSYLWLAEFVEGICPAPAVAEILLKQGFEVSSSTPVGKPISNVVAALVESVQPHPNADKLKVCSVNDGTGLRQVVCGAPNVRAGGKYPLARVGARLPDGLVIDKRSLRGVESQGMMCSARELALGSDHAGLFVLPDDVPVGEDVVKTLGLDDVIFEVEVTPNRPDVLSHWGVAREVAAGLGARLRLPSFDVPTAEPREDLVRVSEPEWCQRYLAAAFDDVKIAPSPLWMRLRLERCGIRSINNAVDVTNYVLLELGHPLHVFDRDRMKGRLEVRRGNKGETLSCLDGQVRSVEGMLVVADQSVPLAVAGVIGGQPSGVTESSVRVLLESARFLPSQVRRARGRLGVSTESSHRFERGTDPVVAEWASRRAAYLLLKATGGRLVARQDVGPAVPAPSAVVVSLSRMGGLLGFALSEHQARESLERFGFSVRSQGDTIHVTPPLHRADVRDTPDVVEEVARSIGYDSVPSRVRSCPAGGSSPTSEAALLSSSRNFFTGLGFWEASQSGLLPRSLWEKWVGSEGEDPPELLNPLSLTGECLNPSLLPNLLALAEGNIRRGGRDVRLFEGAHVFHRGKTGIEESLHIAWVATGRCQEDHWKVRARPLEIWDARSWVDALLKEWRLGDVEIRSDSVSFLHPGECQTLRLGGDWLGLYGRVHPRHAASWGLPLDTFVGEINVSRAARGPWLVRQYAGFSRQPALVRDFSLLFPGSVPWVDIARWVERSCPGVERVELFDVFEGQGLPPGYRSLGFRVAFRLSDRTITDAEAQGFHEKIISGLSLKFGSQARGSTSVAGEKDR